MDELCKNSGIAIVEIFLSNYGPQVTEKLANDKELRGRYAKSARERVDELFTEEKFKQSILGVIEELK